jgi:hypothetical protein
MRLVDVLDAAALLDRAPHAVVVGVQIEGIDQWVLELSDPVEAALPVAVAAALDQLSDLGVTPTPRETSDVHARIIEAHRTFEAIPEEAFRPPGEQDG